MKALRGEMESVTFDDFPARYETGPYEPSPTEIIRRRVLVSGRVQGVSYRETCRQRATELGLTGTVENRPDGSVVAVFEGVASDVGKAIEWCRTGPVTAVVRAIYVADEPLAGMGPPFEILR